MAQSLARLAMLVVISVAGAACGTSDASRPSDTSDTVVATTVGTSASESAPTTTLAVVDRQALVDQARATYGSLGAIALVRDGDGDWFTGLGTADVAGTAITETTRFRIGSITKPIVAALVLDAVNRGELSLDDLVSDLIPGVLQPEPPTTVRMLLDHTSGLFNVGDEGDAIADIAKLNDPAMRAQAQDLAARYMAGERVTLPASIFVALAETHDRYFVPGTGYHYSNANYQLAAMVLEKVTGSSLADLVSARLIEPLGLRYTSIAPDDTAMPEMHGYHVNAADDSLVDVSDDFIAIGNGGSGGIISTAGELLTIMQSMVSGRLLPASLAKEMKEPTTASSLSYGLGLATYYLSCGTFYGHGGSIDGTNSIGLVTPDGSRGTVIAFNVQRESPPDLLPLAESLLCADA
jgi:D-alanyl-D-alanine carboxypeptidase